MKKKINFLAVLIGSFICAVTLAACGNQQTPAPVQLSAPANLQISNTTLTWDAVPNADSYSLQINSDTPITGITEISYQLTALTEAGDYLLKVKAIGNGTAFTDSDWSNVKNYTVGKTIVTVAQPTFSGTLTYGDDLPLIITTTTGGTVALDAGQVLTAGTKNYNWTFTPADTDNYEWINTSGVISLTVNKAAINIAQPAFAGTLTYGDDLPEITTSTTGGTVALNAGQTLTAGTKNYNWTFTPDDIDNYETENGTISLTVAKRDVSVLQPIFSGELTYGDELPAISTATTGGTVALNAGQTLTAGTKNYNWTFTPADTDNYEWSNLTGTISLKVDKKAMSVVQPTYAGGTLVFGGELPTITTITTGGTAALNAGQVLTAGTEDYAWTFTPADTDNYEWSNTTGTIKLTVYKATLSIEPPTYSGAALYYGDNLPTITTTTEGGTVVLDAGQTLRVGTHSYNWTFMPTDKDNLDIAIGTISLTVNKKAVTVAQPVYSGTALTYGDGLPTITTTTTGGTVKLNAGQTLTAGTKNYNWTFTPADTDNYDWSNLTGTISLAVAKKDVSVIQPTFSGTLTYGNSLPTITTITTGGTIVLNAGQTLTAGTKNYNWTFTPSDTDNYNWSNLTGTISLTVNKAAVSVVQPVYSGIALTYGDGLPTITTTTTGGTIVLTEGQTLTAGTKYYNWTFTPSDADNYEIVTGTISLTVAKKAVSVVQPTYSGVALVYSDGLPTITTTTAGGTITLTAGQTLTVGTKNYYWTFTPADTDNYDWSNLTGTISLSVGELTAAIIDERATILILGQQSSVVSVDDKDAWFKFTLTEETAVVLHKAWWGTVGTDANSLANLYAASNLMSPLLSESYSCSAVLQAGTYYIKLYSVNSETTAVSLTLINNMISLGTPIEYRYGNDIWYKLTLSEEMAVKLSASAVYGDSSATVIISVFSSNDLSTVLFSADKYRIGGKVLQAGVYYVKLSRNIVPNTITVANVTISENAIDAGTPTGNLTVAYGDSGVWFVLKLTEESLVKLSSTNTSGTVGAYLYGKDNLSTALMSVSTDFGVLQAGTYYIRVYASSQTAAGSLRVTQMPYENLSIGDSTGDLGFDTVGAWYKLTLTKEESLVFSMTGSSAINFNIFSAQDFSTSLYTISSITYRNTAGILESGTYFIKLHSNSGAQTASLLISDLTNASSITLGAATENISSPTWYKLTIVTPTAVTLSVTKIAGVNPSYEVFSANSLKYAIMSSASSQSNGVLQAGIYYVRVNIETNSQGSLMISDNNVTANTGTNSLWTPSVACYTTGVWYKLTINEYALVTLTVSTGGRDLRADLYSASNLSTVITTASGTAASKMLQAGVYFVKLYAFNTSNNGYSGAVRANVQANKTLTLGTPSESITTDTLGVWCKLTLDESMVLNFAMTKTSGDLRAEVYFADSLTNATLYVNTYSYREFVSGVYYIRLYANSGTATGSIKVNGTALDNTPQITLGTTTDAVSVDANGTWYRLTITDLALVELISTRMTTTDVFASVYSASNLYTALFTKTSSANGSKEVMYPGVYYIRLYVSSASAPASGRVTVNVTSLANSTEAVLGVPTSQIYVNSEGTWYKLTLAETTAVCLFINSSDTNRANLRAEIFHENSIMRPTVNSSLISANMSNTNYYGAGVLQAGVYYIRFYTNTSATTVQGLLNITDLAASQNITLGVTPASETVSPLVNGAWYKLTIDDEAAYELTVSAGNLRADLFSASNVSSALMTATNGQTTSGILRPGNYYIRLYFSTTSGTATGTVTISKKAQQFTDLNLGVDSDSATVSTIGEWYKITLNEQTLVKMITTQTSGVLRADLYSANNLSAILISANNTGSGVLNAGVYYIKLYANSGTATGTFVIQAGGEVSLGNPTQSASIDTNGIWYSLMLDEDVVVRLIASRSAGSGELNARIYSIDNLTTPLLSANNYDTNIYAALPAGKYIVRLHTSSGTATGTLTIFVSQNITLGAPAASVAVNSTGTWYKLTLTEPTAVNLAIAKISGELRATLYSANDLSTTRLILFTSSGYEAYNIASGILQAGTYYIILRSESGTSEGALTVFDLSQSTQILLDQPTDRAAIGTQGVWFKLTLTEETVVRLTTSIKSGSGSWSAYVYSASDISAALIQVVGSIGTVDGILQAGVYYIRFLSSSETAEWTLSLNSGKIVEFNPSTFNYSSGSVTLTAEGAQWYKLTLDVATTLRVLLTRQTGMPRIAFYDSTLTLVPNSTLNSSSTSFQVSSNIAVQAGVYYVKLSNTQSIATTGDFQFNIL